MIDPRRLRVLQALAAHGSVAGAAQALCLTPPAVSQQLLALERETGASLVDRAGRRVRLTAAEAALAIPAGDVCVEFPSVLALVAAGRGAAVIPQMTLGQAPVTICAIPPLGGRHIAAWHRAGPTQPAPPTNTVLDALVRAAASTLLAAFPATAVAALPAWPGAKGR